MPRFRAEGAGKTFPDGKTKDMHLQLPRSAPQPWHQHLAPLEGRGEFITTSEVGTKTGKA